MNCDQESVLQHLVTYKALPLRVFALIDLIVTVFLIAYIVIMAINMSMARVSDNGLLGVYVALEMFLHTFFAGLLIINAKPASVTRLLAIISTILNILIAGVFWGITLYIIFKHPGSERELSPYTDIIMFSYKILRLWFLVAILSPFVILAASSSD